MVHSKLGLNQTLRHMVCNLCLYCSWSGPGKYLFVDSFWSETWEQVRCGLHGGPGGPVRGSAGRTLESRCSFSKHLWDPSCVQESGWMQGMITA